MYLKNPNPKTTYSFRIKPELLENIKNYAKATDQTVPDILADLIEEKTKDLYLTNDYIENTINGVNIIGLPPLMDIYDKGNYREFGLFHENTNRVFYELQRVPNNLDIWDDNKGYTSNKRGVDHEGLSFVLAPELITKPEYLLTPELLFCCLVPVYFKISIKKRSIIAKNISFDEALKKIKATSNMELLDEFTRNTNLIKDIVFKYYNLLDNAIENSNGICYVKGSTYANRTELLEALHKELLEELQGSTTNVNVNLINHYDKVIERNPDQEYTFTPAKLGDTPEELLRKVIKDNEYLLKRVIFLEQQLKDIRKD